MFYLKVGFTYHKIIIQICSLKLNTVVLVMPKVYYNHNCKFVNLKTLYASVRKKRGKSKRLSSAIVVTGNYENSNEVSAKTVFVRDRNHSRQWLALISTNISLSDDEIIRIYSNCWPIEVFFKMSKSFLNFVKEI